MQGGTQSSKPQLQAIIPSAAFAGSVISFILCPAELVKVCMPLSSAFSVSCFGSRLIACNVLIFSSSVECKFREEIQQFLVMLDTQAP